MADNTATSTVAVSAADSVVDDSTQKTGGEAEKTFTAEQVEKIVRDRLDRERKKLAKDTTAAKPSPKDDDFKAQLTERDNQLKTLGEKLTAFKTQNLRATVENRLSALGCTDPDLLADSLLSKGLVHYGDDGDDIVAENVDNNVDSLLRAELAKRPTLQKPTVARGIGSKAPRMDSGAADPKNMSAEEWSEWKASQGIVSKKNRLA